MGGPTDRVEIRTDRDLGEPAVRRRADLDRPARRRRGGARGRTRISHTRLRQLRRTATDARTEPRCVDQRGFITVMEAGPEAGSRQRCAVRLAGVPRRAPHRTAPGTVRGADRAGLSRRSSLAEDAARAIVALAERPRRQRIVGAPNWLAAQAQKFAPGLLAHLTANTAPAPNTAAPTASTRARPTRAAYRRVAGRADFPNRTPGR